MRDKIKGLKIVISLLVLSTMISACIISNNGREAEVEALQQQVDLLATQNSILSEQLAESRNPEDIEYVEAPPPPTADQEPQIGFQEPTAEALPDSPVPAGTTIIYDGWALTLANEIMIDGDKIHLNFVVRNITENSRVFRYVKSGVTLHDNVGNHYPFDMESSSCKSNPDNIHITQQISLNAGRSVNIINRTSNDGFINRIACSHVDKYPPFKGQIGMNINYLVITINDWGPFTGVVFHLDL